MLNKVVLMGRVASDIELKKTNGRASVTNFTLAVEKNFADSDGKRGTDFISLVAWRGTAEFICKYFAKGDLIAVDGELTTRDWETKEGQRRTATEVIVSGAYFTGGKGGDSRSNPKTPTEVAKSSKASKESVPFTESKTDDDPWAE